MKNLCLKWWSCNQLIIRLLKSESTAKKQTNKQTNWVLHFMTFLIIPLPPPPKKKETKKMTTKNSTL